jgi:hypothetical protein
MSNNQSAGAAWKKVINTKNGEVEVLSITIGDKRYTAWPNTFKKEGERSPDYRLQIDTYEPKVNAEDAKQAAVNKQKLKTIQNEDLPF